MNVPKIPTAATAASIFFMMGAGICGGGAVVPPSQEYTPTAKPRITMELEGFSASLIGRVIYVVSDDAHAWIPYEFISGTPYTAKLLITGASHTSARCIEAENTWTAIFRPSTARDWSCIATLIRNMGQSVLLTFDHSCPPLPPAFVNFLDATVAEGRVLLTRIWIGTHVEIPAIPDALFFPVLHDPSRIQDAYEMICRLPARAGHGPWNAITLADWTNMVHATTRSDLGIVVSDVGQAAWGLFWHKIADSATETHAVITKRGLQWLRTGALLVERGAGGAV